MKTSIRQNIRSEHRTVAGTAFGTPPYMPPEQFENAAGCDERSDIYSFGIVLYQMASSGNLPFYPEMTGHKTDSQLQAWYRLHCNAAVPEIKSPLSLVIQKCIEKKPRKRYQAFTELRTDLEPILKRQTGEIIALPKQEEFGILQWMSALPANCPLPPATPLDSVLNHVASQAPHSSSHKIRI